MAEELGASSPDEILGRQIYNPAGFAYRVIGVVENSVLSIAASAGPRPRIFLFNPADLSFHVAKLSGRNLAVAIAAIGLAAMALTMTHRRRGEIGVRKILGGSAAQMTLMLLAAFCRPVAAANLVAWPVAYAAARAYLAIFIDPIELSAMPFVGSLIATLLIGGLAVARQTLGAARLKPAAVLRHE